MNRTFQLHGSGASHPRASNALGLVRVVVLRYFSSPVANGSTPGVPRPKHMKVQTKTQLVSDATRGPPLHGLDGPKHQVNRLEHISGLSQVTCPDPCFSSLSIHATIIPCNYYYTSVVDPAACQLALF